MYSGMYYIYTIYNETMPIAYFICIHGCRLACTNSDEELSRIRERAEGRDNYDRKRYIIYCIMYTYIIITTLMVDVALFMYEYTQYILQKGGAEKVTVIAPQPTTTTSHDIIYFILDLLPSRILSAVHYSQYCVYELNQVYILYIHLSAQ